MVRAMRKLDMSGNMAMPGMAFIDDLVMVGSTDESYDNPDTFDEAWNIQTYPKGSTGEKQ